MRHGILASIAVILIGGSPALAQQSQSPSPAFTAPQQSTPEQQSTSVKNTADESHSSPRLNFLRESLQLTADQQRHWNAYAAAVQNLAKARRHLRQLAQQRTEVVDPNQAIRQQAQAVGDLSAALSGLASAQEPL